MNTYTTDEGFTLADAVAALSMSDIRDDYASLAEATEAVTPSMIRDTIVSIVIEHGLQTVRETARQHYLANDQSAWLRWCRHQTSRMVTAERRRAKEARQ